MGGSRVRARGKALRRPPGAALPGEREEEGPTGLGRPFPFPSDWGERLPGQMRLLCFQASAACVYLDCYFFHPFSIMTALCLKKLMGQALRNDANFITRCFVNFGAQPTRTTMISHTWVELELSKRGFLSVFTKTLCTDESAEEKVKRKKINPSAKKTIESVGRKIPHRIIHLFDERGEDLGPVHRADAIQIMDEKELKLVLLKETADPPVYRLMSGQQILEERLKLREKQKASSKKGPVQQKELTFTTAIAQHDFDMKIKQIQQWVEKKHHVKVIVQEKKATEEPEKMLEFFGRILETMPGKATYLSPPRVLKEGRSMCIYRHMSEKELQALKRMEKEKNHSEGQ